MGSHNEAIERAWTVLLDGLSSPDQNIRDMVVYAALPRLGTHAADRLLPLLESPENSIVALVLEVLLLVEDSRATRIAERLLESADTSVRWNAIDYLGECGDAESVAQLVSIAESTPTGRLDLWMLAGALGNLGDRAAIPQLLRILSEPDHHTVAAAAQALGLIGSSEALPALIRLLESDADWEPRSAAAGAIGMIGDQTAIAPLLKAATNQHEDHKVRTDAAVGLIRLDHDAEPAVLVQMLDSPNEDIREWATTWCHWLAYAPATSKLIEFVEDQSEKPDIRLRAIYALGQIGGEDAARALIARLHDPQERWRAYAAGSLGDVGTPAAIQALITALNDDQYDVRSAAVFGLGELREQAALPALLGLLRAGTHDPDHEVPVALAKLGYREITPALQQAVMSGESYWSAVQALEELGNMAIIPELAELLDNTSEYDRVSSAAAIIRLTS